MRSPVLSLFLTAEKARIAVISAAISDLSLSMEPKYCEPDPAVTEPSCDRTPTAGVAQLYRLARMVRADLPRLRQPLLILKSRQDHVLSARNATLTLREAGSARKEIIWLDHSYHVATMDHDKDLIAAEVLAFFTRIAQEEP